MFSNVITRSNRKQKRDTYKNLDKKKANTIDNIDILVDTLLGKINHASSTKRNAVKTILVIRQRLSTKKLLSITLSFLLIFAVIASASSLVELNNQSTDLFGISVDDSPVYNSTFQNNESLNISLTNDTVVNNSSSEFETNESIPPSNNNYNNSLTNDTVIDNSSSEFETNESIPPSDNNIVNESLNQTITYSGLNLTLYVNKNVYVENETVFINGIVLYNNSTINTTVELSIVGSNFNSSLSLAVFEGRFNFEFIPVVNGSLRVRGLVIYFNETDEEEIVIHVLNTTDYNLTLYGSELLIWDETDYQMKYVGDQITFYANYSNTNICIANASCLISFNVGTWTTPELMNFSDGVYMYNRSFDIVGSFDYQVWCSAISFENRTSSDNFVVSEDISDSTEVSIVNPMEKEFVYTVPGTSFYVERNINGLQNISAIFAPLFSDGLNIESIEIIKHDDSGSNIVEILRDNRPNKFTAGKGISAIERRIDNLRDRLPPKLKQLNHISYTDSFNLDGPVTVRIWFKAPSWEEINTGLAPSSGQISYLIFTDNSYDFESSTWWNSNWGKRKLITINSSQVDTDLTNFPILVYNSSDSDLATYAQTDGDDIAFVLYSDNTTKLNHELENYTASGQIIAWVNVTSLSSSSDTKIWMYYNNSACSNQENVIGTWDSDYMGVWHLAETPSGALDITDSTWVHNGTSQNMESTDQVAGEVNGCLLFDGSAEYVLIPDSSDWTLSNDLDWTMEGWFNFSTLPGSGDWDSMIGTPSDPYSFEFNEDGGDTTINWWDGTSDHESSGQSSITTNEFHYGVLVLNFGFASGSQWYLDGTSLGTFTAENRNVNPTGLTISGDGNPNYFTGNLDEIRFSNTLRNASWITTSYNTVNNRSNTFLSFGNEETSNKPTQSGESPINGSTEVSVTPALYVVCSDDDAGDTLNATWWSNSSGSWVQFASNETSFASGTNITQTNNNFSDYNKTYYWSVNLTDGESGWNNETYHFTTENISTSVNTILPYNITLSPLNITATGPSDLDNITLWYRWSNDNISWDGGINDETKNAVDTNITDVDSSSDKGVETDFTNAQTTNVDSNNMTISEENTGPSGADEYQYVDGLDDTWLEWQTENGASPYLDATDDGNWIHEDNSASRQEGWFNFSDTSETGTGFNITFDFYCYGNDNDDGWDIYYEYTGDSTPEGSISFTCTQTGSYAWLSSSELIGLTATQINNMRIYLDTWNGAGGDDRWVDACRMHITRTAYDNYEMDLEYNWTTADYNGTIEEVCIYVDYHTGSENLNVSYRDGNSWTNLATISSTGWNNFTATGLNSQFYTIQFIGTSETSDTNIDIWEIDCIFLHVYNDTGGPNGYNWSEWDNSSNPDTGSPWSWDFNFPNSTGYYEFYSIGNKSGSPNETAPSIKDASCFYNASVNNAPIQSGESPINGSTGISITPALYVVCSDYDSGDTLNATWWSNSSGSWLQFGSNETIFASGTNITQTNSNFSNYITTYYWSVNLSDGEGGWNNETYLFTTEINTSVDAIIPYEIKTSPHTINATGDSDLDKVTLYYRYSSDNTSWDFLSENWWNSNWGYRKLITVDSSQVESDLTNFPMLIYNSSDNNLANYAQNDGDDIVFILYSDNTTKLNHEIALYNNSSGQLAAWVNITDLNSSIDTKIWMYYNNSACSSQENVANTWDSDYEIVWHLQEDGNGTTDEYIDSSKNACNGTGGKDDDSGGLGDQTETPDRVNGKFGYAQDFNDDGANGDKISSQDLTSAWTAVTGSVWINGNAAGDDRLWGKSWGTGVAHNSILMRCIGTGADQLGCRFRTDTSSTTGYQPASMGNNIWIYMVLTWDGSDDDIVRIYENGTLQGTGQLVSGATLYDTPPHEFFTLGNVGDGANNRCFDGYIQEARMSSIRRSDEWIETEYNNQNNLTTFLSFDNNEKINFSWMLWNNATNPDTNSPWSWSFDFPNGTGYYEFYSIGNKSDSPNETAPNNADARCNYNPYTFPTVITNSSTGIQENNATLWGYLSSNGSLDTTCGFRFGTSSGSYSENFTKGIYPSNTEFTNNNGSLTQGQIYFYQSWANNSIGFANGTEVTFLTKPNQPTSLTAQANSTLKIFLSWTSGTGANNTYIERNASGASVWAQGDGIIIYNGSGTNYEDTNLADGVTYYYQAWSYANWTYDSNIVYQWSDLNASASNVTHDRPNIDLIIPSPNGTTGIGTLSMCQIWANDSDSSTLNVYWYENSTGEYILKNTNSSISANSIVSYTFMEFSNYSTTYYWKVEVNDSTYNSSEWYYFTTNPINTSINTIYPYNVTYSPYNLTVSGYSDLDKVTLWYQYSTDNISWSGWMMNTTDSLSPWKWDFTFSNGTGYYEFYSIGNKSGSPNETAPGIADTICYYNTSINNPPTQNNEIPAHQSSEISLTPQLTITVNDGDLDTINVTWWSNSSGSWIQFGSNLSIDTSSGPVNIIQTNTNFSHYFTKFWWSINITDGIVWTNETYYFTTEPINTSVDTITPYIVTESPKTIDATGPSGLDNVSLWYQFSTNNFSWWNSNWGYRKLITVDSSQVESDLTNFPMLVYNSSDTDLVNYAQSDGDDITFILYSDNTTKLNHEIALYNNSSGELAAWVNITDLNSSIDTKIWMYYNNSACSSQENVTGTWNSDYEIIWHLQEEGNGTTDEYNDSSKNSCHGTGGKDDDSGGLGDITETPDRINGKFGYAQDFNVDGATGDRISSQDLTSAWSAVTGSIWIYGNAAGDDRLWGKTFGTADNAHTILMNCIGTGANTLGCRFRTDIQNTPNYHPASMENDAWIYMVLTWDGSDDDLVRIYKNGQFQGSISVNGATLYDSPPHEFFTLGNNGDGATNRCFDGYIQEARMSSIRRSYDWIETEYNNQNNLTTFLSFDNNEKINFSWMLWNNATNPDTNSPWSWNFKFPNGTGYYEFYSIGNKSGSPNETAPVNADANCYYLYVNSAPTQYYQLIWDNFSAFLLNNTDIRLNPISLNVTISDLEGSNMNITILTNESGIWNIVNQSSGSGLSNGTYSFTNTSWIDTYNKKYYVSFNLTDGTDWANETYNFTTIIRPPEGESFIKNTTFGNNLGIQSWNETNSTYFWKYIHYFADIAVEESTDNSTWYRNDATLTINRNKNSDEEKEKETFNFTAPKYGYYRIVIYFRKPLLNYWDNSSVYEYSLACEANATENYAFYFNWSDYINSDEATITTSKYGIMTKNGSDYFYWIVTINDPLNADETFQIDPTFGDENEGTSGDDLEDTIRGSIFQMPENGNANSISAYLYYETSGPNFYNVKAAIYNNNSVLMGSTEERSLSNTDGIATWETFTFSSSPFLTGSENYYIVIWANSPTGSNTLELRYDSGTNNNNYSSQTYGTWPSPVSFLDQSGDYQYNIYCTYTPNNLSVISFPGPANESSGILPRPVCNVTVYDQDGGTVDVYFYENTTGDDIWVLQQTNSSVDVTSAANVEWDNYTNVTVESTKYWWRVVVIDENGGTVEEYYHFTTVGISVSIDPATWHQGVLTVGSSNETTAFYFELTNSGSTDIDLQIKATNATNATTGAKWKLNDTVGLDNYSLQYNLSDGGTTWTNINLTYDTFVNNLGSSSSKTFDLKLILATLSSKSDPLQITLTFRSVLS